MGTRHPTTIILIAVAPLMVAFPVPARAGDVSVGRVSWSQANLDALRSSDKAAIAKFINANLPPHWTEVPPYSVVEAGRASVGGGKYDFLALLDISGRGYSNTLMIYSQNSAGNPKPQVIYGWKMGNLKQMVRDLNGSGEDELVITKEMGPGGSWSPLMDMPAWPAVYRLENGKYVESSRDFSSFYDNEVLPQLDKAVAEMGQKATEGREYRSASARDMLVKNKILRVLGRDPTAGLQQAYQWMNSDDPQVLQCAIATFYDIGGHEEELRAAQQRLPNVEKRAIESSKGKR